MKPDIKNYTVEELKAEMTALGEKAFRAKQIYEWIHVKLADSFDEMTNIPAVLRRKLEENYSYTKLRQLRMQESMEDGTRKYLFELPDGNTVETV